MRKLLAIWAAKLLIAAGRLAGKGGTAAPGEIALRICPDLIRILSQKVKCGIVVTCGTNGKTTTNNLLNTALQKSGYTTVCNRLGANMLGGVATAFAEGCTMGGRFSADWAVLEVDEAFARKVFAHLKPTHMVITNLFRDQLDRYGEIETTMALLEEAIGMAEGVQLILNGDDPLTAPFGRGRNAVYYGIAEQVLPQTEETREGRFCPQCGKEQEYHYVHYNQLGDYYCPHCGHRRPRLDFAAEKIRLEDKMEFAVNGHPVEVNYRGFYNIYNILAVYAAVCTMGLEEARFPALLEDYQPQVGRMEQIHLGKPFILNLAKNPAGFNQAIQTVMLDKRKKDIILAVNDMPSDGQDVSWLWDVNFEGLCDGNTGRLIVCGSRCYDLALRFRYAGIPVDRIEKDMEKALTECMEADGQVCYVLVNYTVLFPARATMLELKKKKEEGGEIQ